MSWIIPALVGIWPMLYTVFNLIADTNKLNIYILDPNKQIYYTYSGQSTSDPNIVLVILEEHIVPLLSIHNSLLGGVQLGIQCTLSVIQHLLFLASPFTGGVSLISSAPVALAQAVVAIHTTKITGRLAAEELLQNSYRSVPNPTSILRQLTRTNSQMSQYLLNWDMNKKQKKSFDKALLP